MQAVSFLEAIEFAKSRGVLLPDEFYGLDLRNRALATTVKLLTSMEQMQQVINLVNRAIANGETFADFKKSVEAKGIVLSQGYLDNVFRTNVQTAYNHGKYTQQQRNKAKRPYLKYSAINDSRVRPSHLALNKVIRPVDDDFWLKNYPPLGYQCRCTVISLTNSQAERLGITLDDDLPPDGADDGWGSSPAQYGDLMRLVDQKAMEMQLNSQAFLSAKAAAQAELNASAKMLSLMQPMTDKSRELLDLITETALPLDKRIKPYALRLFLGYVQNDAAAISSFVKRTPITLADDVLQRWIAEDMAQIQAVATNTAATVAGFVSVDVAASLQVGKTVTIAEPLYLDKTKNRVKLLIENAAGYGIAAELLNAGTGVLFMPLAFEVLSMQLIDGIMTYTLRILKN